MTRPFLFEKRLTADKYLNFPTNQLQLLTEQGFANFLGFNEKCDLTGPKYTGERNCSIGLGTLMFT
jgi:hypothetical protein